MADFVAQDTKPVLEVTCMDYVTKQPLNLSGQTVMLRFKIGKFASAEREMEIVNPPTEGKVRYRFATGELKPGLLIYEITIIDSESLELTSRETGAFEVRPRVQ